MSEMLPRRILLACVAGLTLCQAMWAAPALQDNGWQELDRRTMALYEQGDLPQAIEAAAAALKVAASPRESGRSLDRLGFLYYTSGKLDEGERYLRESLRTCESAFGADSLEYAEAANDFAMLLRDLKRMDEAKVLARQAVDTRLRLLGDRSPALAESLNTLATVHALSGDYLAAVSMFERALTIHEKQAASERATEEYGTLCINLAGTYQRIGKFTEAEAVFQKGLASLRVKPGVKHPAYAASLLAAAALEVDLGRFSEAERMYDEGGRLVRAELGERHPVYSTLLNNRGFFYQSIGNAAAAEADYRQSLELKRALFGAASPATISALRNLAHLTYARDHRAGEALLAEAVAAYARLSNPPSFEFASVLVGLARAQRDRGALTEARATATRALEVSRAGLGDRHPLFASATRELGLTLAAAGEYDSAEQQMGQALRIAEEVHGPNHPDVAAFLDAFGDFYVGRKNYQAAESLYARSLDIQNRFSADVLEIGSETFKTASMATASDPIPRLLAFQALAAQQLPAARALAFEAVASRKGRVVEHVRNWRQQLEDNRSPAVQREVGEWHALLECRASLTVALGYRDLKPGLAGTCSLHGTDLEGRYERLLSDLRSRWTADVGAKTVEAIGVLQERADRLEASLNRETAGMPGQASPPRVDALRRQLSDEDALVEFVAYDEATGSGGGSASKHYGAFVLTRSVLAWTDLGPARPIDTSISDLLAAARDWSVSIANHENVTAHVAEQTAHDALRDLSSRVWRPIRAGLDAEPRIRRLRIAPDGALNLVPFDALSEGRDLIERFEITYVPAGRDLLSSPSRVSSSAPVVVVSPGAGLGLVRLGSATGEAADLKRLVPGAAVYTGATATEHHVKGLRAPSLLHVVGHGIVRSEACQSGPCGSTSLDASARAMSLAAIVLEEAYGRSEGSADDGMLTALELENMDLRGTEMLVLSQCQMASGMASVGEGVYGMRRAAAIAGVQTFVAPLWNVEDGVQRRLMRLFYTRLAAGETRAGALRHAKLALKRTAATKSFLYWAPVILSGSPATLPPALFQK
jgi:CHAT domain-containing protein/tetratricopeptide (TPR) repeat protein